LGAPYEIAQATLSAIVDGLQRRDVALSYEFGEMVRARGHTTAADPTCACSSTAAAEFVSQPMTLAEATAAEFLRAVTTYAHQAELDDQTLHALAAHAVVFVARFETYLAERSVADHQV
jgi:hypothetical protein